MPSHLRLRDVRAAFRLIGDVRAAGGDPARWRPLMVRRLRKLFRAEVVVSSEVHVRAGKPSPAGRAGGPLRVIDVGWGCDGTDGDHVWRIATETDAPPGAFLLAVAAPAAAGEEYVPVKPTAAVRGGSSFVLSQYPLAHLGAIDQLGLHRGFDGHDAFTPADHRLIRLFHVELGRLWRRDALRQASDPGHDLPPRLAQTLAALQDGCSEKEVSTRLGISPHTVHNYVKALHSRFGVTSRGELLAKVPKPTGGFVPKLSVELGGAGR